MKILSPAGSYEAMVAAVLTGADAVYLGLSEFSARAGAKNFTVESLSDAVSFCHKRSVEVFVALNTIIYDNEILKVKKLIEAINTAQADGVIIQDFAVFEMVRTIAPELKAVASTQMTVNNVSGAKILEKNGFDTVVLPRELSETDIKRIKKQTNINLEVFAHGALCVCYSGQCLMSSFIGERSGNRGKCAQPCRMLYNIPNKQGYFLSTCDLSLINRLDRMSEIGIDTIKIEGRLKSEYYAAAITDVYRRVLDSNDPPTEEDFATIHASFMRGGYTTGYFDEINDRRLFNFAKKENPYSRETQKLENHYKQVLSQRNTFHKKQVKLLMSILIDKNISGTIEYNGKNLAFESKTVAVAAKNAPLTKEKIITQLAKTGNETFDFSEICINSFDDNIFISVSDINNIRREIGILIDKEQDNKRVNNPFSYNMQKRKTVSELGFYCVVKNAFQLKWIKEMWDVKVFAPIQAIEDYKAKKYGSLENVGVACGRIVSDKAMTQIMLYMERNKALTDILIGNLGYIEKFSGNYNIYGDFPLNITNTLSAKFYEDNRLSGITASVEANIKNIKNIMTDNIPLAVVGYGKIPLMITESCIKSNIKSKCQKNIPLILTDRKEEEFIVECESFEGNCMNVIYNNYPIMMADKLNDVRAAGINQVCLQFTDENKMQLEEIIRAFKLEQNPLTRFTRGHFYRGAY